MEWEDKVTLCEKIDNGHTDLREFINSKVDSFDAQASDMAITSISFLAQEMEKDLDWYERLISKCAEFRDSFDYRTTLRLKYVEQILKELKDEKAKETT